MTLPPFDALWFRLICGLVVGLCLGSFITMLSYRLPRRLSIVIPGSHCPSCDTPLTVRDLVPVLSWLVMQGCCRHCGAKIGKRYVLIEITMALLSAIAFVTLGFQWKLACCLLAIIVFIASVVIIVERNSR